MISIQVDEKENSIKVSAGGNVIGILSETIMGIRAMYESIEEHAGEECAEAFKNCMTRAFADGIVFAKDEKVIEQKIKDLDEEIDLSDKDLEKMFKKFADDLAEILK